MYANFYTYQEKDERMKSNPDLYFNCATVSGVCLFVSHSRLFLVYLSFISYIFLCTC